MGDDEDTSSISLINEPPVRVAESTMEDMPSGERELPSSDQCDSLPECVSNLDDSQSSGADTSPVVKEEEPGAVAAEAEGGIILVERGAEKCVPVQDELPVLSCGLATVSNEEQEDTVVAEGETVMLGCAEENSVPSAGVFAASDAEFTAPGSVEDRETVAAEGNVLAEREEDKCVPEGDDVQLGSVEPTTIVKVDEAEKGAEVEENLAVECREVVNAEDKSLLGADELAVAEAEPTLLKEHDDVPVDGAEPTCVVKEDELAAGNEEALLTEIETGMDTDAIVNVDAEQSCELHVAELADVRESDIGDDATGNAVAEMGAEARDSAGGDVVAVATDVEGTVGLGQESEEIPAEEAKMEIKVELDVAGDSDVVAPEGDLTTLNEGEMGLEHSKGSGDASDQEEDDDMAMEMESKVTSRKGESLPDAQDLELQGALSPMTAIEDEEGAPMADEEIQTMDAEMETETEVEPEKGARGKRKRGKNSKSPSVRAAPRKTVGEDVCFICFDGGDLVLCDRRGCPKAYHPSCVNRDEAFFRAKGKWNCGWHLCSMCEKNAYYMCYTCTFSLCKGCIKDAVILCIRGNKGFCETCMKTVMLIENNEHAEAPIDFDDKNNWEFLFKDYYMELKEKLSISSVELAQSRNPWKGSDLMSNRQDLPDEFLEGNDDVNSGSDNSLENKEMTKPKRRKTRRKARTSTMEEDLKVAAIVPERPSVPGNAEWASKELLEFVMHMRNGEKSILSQFDVQALLLEYIKQNKLRDPRRKSQIVCDARLENLFGKARVGHFEMLKLIESHFLIKEDSQTDDIQGIVVDTDINQTEADANMDSLSKGVKEKKRKARKKGDGRGQSNLDDYAAIDMHNISLIYLRRNLMEDLLEDVEKFHDKVVGCFVRIRISGNNLKQDIYRLVQVVGTNKALEPYKVGKRTTDITLEILNLSKTEVVSIDTISNQEFTEDECKRLRQSIKCGLINRLTVGDVLDKAMEVHAARVNDWLESETVRLSHLRDRASDMGRRKELRECVEKLQLLKTPEERRRRLEEIPEIKADPKMDPSYESEEDESDMDDKREFYTRPRGSDFSRRMKEPISPGKSEFSSKDSWSGTRSYPNKNWESNRNLSNKSVSIKAEETTPVGEVLSEASFNQGENDTRKLNKFEKVGSATISDGLGWNNYSAAKSEPLSAVTSETSSLSVGVEGGVSKINETEKVWHYQDPSRKVQGPFSMSQLRKWNKTGYFPAELRIWRTSENQADSVLLTDILAGRFQKILLSEDGTLLKATTQSQHFLSTQVAMPSVEVPKLSSGRGSDFGPGNESTNLPSPTPSQSAMGRIGGEVGHTAKTSSFPVAGGGLRSPVAGGGLRSPVAGGGLRSPVAGGGPRSPVAGGGPRSPVAGGGLQSPVAGGGLQSPVAASSSSAPFSRSASSFDAGRNKEQSFVGSLGVLKAEAVINSDVQLTRSSGTEASNVHSSVASAHNSEQYVPRGSTSFVQVSRSTDNSHGLQLQNRLIPSSDTPVQTVQSFGSQNLNMETRDWGQKLESNSSMGGPVQAPNYGQWTSASAGHISSENFSNQGVSAVLPGAAWGPQLPVNQGNMQPSVQSNVLWGMGAVDNKFSGPSTRPENANTGWASMQGNPNAGWGGLAPGNLNMNWGAVAQGPAPGNPGSGWVVAPQNQGAAVQGQMPANFNPVWMAPPVNQGAVGPVLQPGTANPGWVPPTGNIGATVPPQMLPMNGNPGWMPPPTGNPGANIQGPAPGNPNPGWVGGPQPNQGTWGGGQHQNGDMHSNQRDGGPQGGDSGFKGGRPWNRQPSFGNEGPGPGGPRLTAKAQRACPYLQMGHCKKGSRCDYMHT